MKSPTFFGSPLTCWLFVVVTTLIESTVADLPFFGSADAKDYNDGIYGQRPGQTFRSSNVTAPRLMVNHWDKTKCSPESLIFLSASTNETTIAPLILSAKDLSMIYTNASFFGGSGLRPQQYNGSTYLTFVASPNKGRLANNDWPTRAHGFMLDDQYNIAHEIKPEIGRADGHEFQLTNDGTALMVTLNNTRVNHTFVDGSVKEIKVMDMGFVELDIATGKDLFRFWGYSDLNITDLIEDAYHDRETVSKIDFVHMNAVMKTRDGNYFMNARHLCAMMKINSTSKEIIWQLGGKNNMFRDISNGAALDFIGQHNPYFTNEDETEIHLFDNHLIAPSEEAPPSPGCSKNGCANSRKLRINYEEMTVELLYAHQHPAGVNVYARGGSHETSNGNSFTAWGSAPTFTEMTAEGESCMEIQLGPWAESLTGLNALYRGYKFDWKATPYWDPSIAVEGDKVYVSWNGATEVDSWVLIGGMSESQMTELMTLERQGFETELDIGARLPLFIRVEARDKNGLVLRSTRIVESYPIL